MTWNLPPFGGTLRPPSQAGGVSRCDLGIWRPSGIAIPGVDVPRSGSGVPGAGFLLTAPPRPPLAQLARRQLHRLEDLRVAGAAAEVARERERDRFARRLGVPLEQGRGAHQDPRRAEAALGTAGAVERVLERVRRGA